MARLLRYHYGLREYAELRHLVHGRFALVEAHGAVVLRGAGLGVGIA